MMVTFVTNTGHPDVPYSDASVRYRCYNPASALAGEVRVKVVSTEQFLGCPFFESGTYVFHRPTLGGGMLEHLNRLRDLGCKLVADYDDLIFGDKSLALCSSAYKSGRTSEEGIVKVFENNTEGLRYFDEVTVSTEPLRQQAIKWGKEGVRASCVENRLSDEYLKWCGRHLQQTTPKRFVIGYASGSKSHDEDLEMIANPLIEVLEKYPHVMLKLVGPVSAPKAIPQDRLITAPLVQIPRLPYVLHRTDTLLAPLHASRFNECKSSIKFLEAAAQGIPVVASGTEDFVKHPSSKLLVANHEKEWVDALSHRIEAEWNETHRTDLRNYATEAQSVGTYASVYKSIYLNR